MEVFTAPQPATSKARSCTFKIIKICDLPLTFARHQKRTIFQPEPSCLTTVFHPEGPSMLS